MQFGVCSVISFGFVGSYRPVGLRTGRRVRQVSSQNHFAVPSTQCRGRIGNARVPYLESVVRRYVSAITLKTTYPVYKTDINVDVRIRFVKNHPCRHKKGADEYTVVELNCAFNQ